MSEQRPTVGLRALPKPNQALFESLFYCVRCKKIPHPSYYKVCEEKGHFQCVPCVEAALKEKSVTEALCSVEDCCAPENLQPGHPHLLQQLFQWSFWDCDYKSDGCNEICLGREWARHVMQCEFQRKIPCKYVNCTFKGRGVKDLVQHLKVDHNALQFDGQICKLHVEYKETGQRLIALLSYQDKHFVFSSEVKDSIVYMWIWDLQTCGDDKKENSTQKYEMLLNLANGNSQDGMRFTGSCLSYAVSSQKIVDEGRCFLIPEAIFRKNYIRQSKSKLVWTLDIKFLKDNGI